MLFNEPKLLKSYEIFVSGAEAYSFSALQRAEIAEIAAGRPRRGASTIVSVLFNEPKLLKSTQTFGIAPRAGVSVLFNEPKLLKCWRTQKNLWRRRRCFSALQRAEIAEIWRRSSVRGSVENVSVLFNEPKLLKSFRRSKSRPRSSVSVLFNEPKLLK